MTAVNLNGLHRLFWLLRLDIAQGSNEERSKMYEQVHCASSGVADAVIYQERYRAMGFAHWQGNVARRPK